MRIISRQCAVVSLVSWMAACGAEADRTAGGAAGDPVVEEPGAHTPRPLQPRRNVVDREPVVSTPITWGLPGELALERSFTCVSAAFQDDTAFYPQVVRLRVAGEGAARTAFKRVGAQLPMRMSFTADGRQVTVAPEESREFATTITRGGATLANGERLTITRQGAFAAARLGGAGGVDLTCWNDDVFWTNPLPARLDWNTGTCVDERGLPALNAIPWDAVRESGMGECADLTGARLNGDDYGYPLVGYVDLRGARLTGAALYFADLEGSFDGADLSQLEFGYANVNGTISSSTRLPPEGCTVQESPWAGAIAHCMR